jgi:hypothetical protein
MNAVNYLNYYLFNDRICKKCKVRGGEYSTSGIKSPTILLIIDLRIGIKNNIEG